VFSKATCFDLFSEYNQDATFLNLFISVRRSPCFRRVFPSIIRSSKLHIRCQVFVGPIPDTVCAVLISWWWTEKPVWNMLSVLQKCIKWETSHLVGCILRIYWRCTKLWMLNVSTTYRSADKSLARPGRKQANVSVRTAWFYFGVLPCWGGGGLMTARVSMSLKSHASVACFRICFRPGRAKNLSAPRYVIIRQTYRI